MRQRVVAANHKVGQPVVGEQRRPAKRPLSVRPEIVDGVVMAAAEVAAESYLVPAVRPAQRVYELTLAPRKIVGIRRIDAKVARHADLPLVNRIVVIPGAQIHQALTRLNRHERAIGVAPTE